MFRTLPAMTPGHLHPPLPGHATLPRLSEPAHGKLPNGLERHGGSGSDLQGTYLPSRPRLSRWQRSQNLFLLLFPPSSEQAGDAVESLADADSVKGLGETTDFLNMVRERAGGRSTAPVTPQIFTKL